MKITTIRIRSIKITIFLIILLSRLSHSKIENTQNHDNQNKKADPTRSASEYTFSETERPEPIHLPSPPRNRFAQPDKKFDSLTAFWNDFVFCGKLDSWEARPVASVTVEKPAYKPGQMVHILLFCFDSASKRPLPLDNCNVNSLSLRLLDPGHTKVGAWRWSEISSDSETNPHFLDPNQTFSAAIGYQIDSQSAGGKFTLDLSSSDQSFVDKTAFTVSSYQKPKELLILDLNKDVLSAQDDLMAKATLKILGNDPSSSDDYDDHQQLLLHYEITDNVGRILESGERSMLKRVGFVEYTTPTSLEDISSIDVRVWVFYKGRTMRASRKLFVFDVDRLEVDFSAGAGNFSTGRTNEVFFQVFSDSSREQTVSISDARVVRVCPDEPLTDSRSPPSASDVASQEVAQIPLFARILGMFKSLFSASEEPKSEPSARGSLLGKRSEVDSRVRVSPDVNFYDLPQNEFSNKDIIFRGQTVLSSVESDGHGRGSFRVLLSHNCSFYLQIEKNRVLKNFFIVNTNPKFFVLDQSDLHLQVKRRVLSHDDDLVVRVSKPVSVLATNYILFVQDKGRILLERQVQFEKCAGYDQKFCYGQTRVPVSELSMPQGGVFTVQVYRNHQFYRAEQEALVFVYPRRILSVDAQLDKTRYAPGDPVRLQLSFGVEGILTR